MKPLITQIGRDDSSFVGEIVVLPRYRLRSEKDYPGRRLAPHCSNDRRLHQRRAHGLRSSEFCAATSNRTRLIIRGRRDYYPDFKHALLNFIYFRLIFEPAHFIMERKMMLGIKERAEAFTADEVDGPR